MKATRLWLTTIAALLFSLTASAHNFEVEGIYYNITSATDLTVSVTCRGSSYDSYSNEYTGEVTIPAKVNYNSNTYSVTSIGYGAFYGCSNLTTITIPESMKNIGDYAFYGCSSLTTVTIPEGVKSIGAYTFSGCSSLTTITFPSSVTSIGASAFSGCSSLTAITIPEKVASIGTKTFELCSSLSYITLSEGLTTIGESAFSGCRSLSSITIPATVTSIGGGAFDNCSSLRSITFEDGSSLLSIGCKSNPSGGLFDDCPLESIYLGRDIKCDATYYGSVYAPFRENASLLALSIGECVTCIYESFNSCCNLSSITFSENSKLASIGVGAFEYCSSLTSITIPESVTSIGEWAFYRCSALTNLTIGCSVSSIGEYAFAGCSDIENIYALNPKAITYDESVFSTDAYNNAILYVPTDRAFAYEKATPWSKFQIEPMKKFTVTYMVDGKAYETKEVEYASEITLIDEPVKEGYTFTGWSEVSETMPAKDIVVNGSFVANKYLVTFKVGDEVIAADSLVYGSEIIVPKAPEKEGYTFNGWGEVPETVPANDVIYEGTYSINSYRLIYYVDGEIYMVDMLTYGAVIELLEKPTKNGYTFEGWSNAPETMPAEDVTISGTFTRVNVTHITITINQYGSGTYCSPYALDFNNVQGLKAYAAAGYNDVTGVVTLLRVMTTQPGTGLFVKGEPGTYDVPVLESSSDHTINMLVGTLTKTSVNTTSDDGIYANYKYTKKDKDPAPMFYQFTDGSTVSAGKAYLQIPMAWLSTTGEARSIGLRFDEGEGATDIENPEFNIQNSELV